MTQFGIQEPRWRRVPAERPTQIINAALEVFGEVGLARARLEDIARRAGISKGTIYVYFPHKEELFKEVVRQMVIQNIERAERDEVVGTPTEQLNRLVFNYWQFLRSPVFGALHRMILSELRNLPELAEFYATEAVARGIRLVSSVIQRGIDQGEFREVDPEATARCMVAMCITHAIWTADRHCFPYIANKSDDEILGDMRNVFLGALVMPPK